MVFYYNLPNKEYVKSNGLTLNKLVVWETLKITELTMLIVENILLVVLSLLVGKLDR